MIRNRARIGNIRAKNGMKSLVSPLDKSENQTIYRSHRGLHALYLRPVAELSPATMCQSVYYTHIIVPGEYPRKALPGDSLKSPPYPEIIRIDTQYQNQSRCQNKDHGNSSLWWRHR